MASAAVGGFLHSHPIALCPPPLHIQKKPRRATFRRPILRKSTHSQPRDQYVHGPLDDIIDEIRSDIWALPRGCSFNPVLPGWQNPLKVPLSWTVTPLPVSRIPSDQPLTIRKNRNSRSSASGSSASDPVMASRSNSQDEASAGGAVRTPSTPDTTPWPSFDADTLHEPTRSTELFDTAIRTEHATAQQSRGDGNRRTEAGFDVPPQRRTSRLRQFTSGFPRLRRSATGGTAASAGGASGTTSHDVDQALEEEPSEEAVEAGLRRNASNCKTLMSVMQRMVPRFPAPVDCDEEQSTDYATTDPTTMPTTIRAAVRIFPETKLLVGDYQEINVAIEVEGVLHNREALPDTIVDIIFVVDNGYYVTRDCLEKAIEAVNGTLYHLRRGDRLALYTTHCTHNTVTGNKPELHHPIQPFSTDSEEIFHDLTANICRYGTQAWDPPRPNPSMTDVVLGIAKSLQDQDLTRDRTHIILLSPATYVLHKVSESLPNLYIHRINPAALPYRRDPELQDTVCYDSCCQNVFVSNWASYQSVPGRIKRILKYARSKKPVGELTSLAIDIRTKDGCELVECIGSKDLPCLRLGQVHSIFARIRVDRAKAQEVDLESVNPVFRSSLDAKGLRQELQNAVALGAVKVHLFDVQLYHRNSIMNVDCWSYTETPLFIIKELGRLAYPLDTAMEVYKRQYFHKFIQLSTDTAKMEADNLLAVLNVDDEQARRVVGRFVKEIKFHQEVSKYEQDHRQKLPRCFGPIEIEASHEWLVNQWSKRKNKRNGMAGVENQDLDGLIDGFDGLGRARTT